ncbi:hypothetical protein [Roseomonas sp. 18066]|uniref:hypothetical protein n=1 Tax=Roseomonas sp. 18066 TaxID=2681412 RepID=UPI0013575A34|nr:hypothetical protein [Roseomonas sp. 18066]
MGRGRSRNMPKPRSPRPAPRPAEAPRAGGEELDRLRRERDDARALLQDLMAKDGAGGAAVARRLAALEEERMVARGQAVEAALARGRAEAALKALSDAIDRAPGIQGWLLRRARRKVIS